MSKKVIDQEENDIPAENASPVCYINADELRPEYKQELENEIKARANKKMKRATKKSG